VLYAEEFILIFALSWSPDGAHITASNATNNKGFVFIAAVITRNSWTSDISLVGHENTVEVAVSIFVLTEKYPTYPLHRLTIRTYSFEPPDHQ
jgi:WD40 repeat protein